MRTLALILLFSFASGAQSPGSIQATGNATLTVKPDQATLSIGVITQAVTAQQAADLNAPAADAVIKALSSVLGGAGTIETISYSITARYSTDGRSIVGYTASNTVQVVTTNLGIVGALIDAGNRAGANSVNGPYFGLQNSEPQRQQALAAAAKQALAHVAAIASGLGAKTGAVLSATEGATVYPVYTSTAGGAAAPTTPIETGSLTITATVTVTVALVQ